jgi:tetratricopeptide (TPR) repeat protein
MAKVSLRIYNREIERLIEQGHTDEAIAHCRHILRTFPKHLETYRLLGKAYLEARRYGEAVDVFGRLLMAVPDDFVAHVGLSIISDEENKLDDAIWHMQRAFESQSANAAIQDELKRLYVRRDGVEPPKVRMTRGALARMYVQGELYPQAISEIRAVLAEDPKRADMQVLLAHSFFKSGQKSDASDICNQLIKRYPYCFDANRIMVDLLPATADTSESTQVYRMRVGEMDPYANFAKGSIFQTAEVPDASINLERLEYSGEEVPMDQGWASSLGIGYEAPALTASSADDQPDWLKSGGAGDVPSSQHASEAEDAIPDFLRDAGWSKSDTPEQPTSIFDEEPAGGIVPADLPDWLKDQAPVSSSSNTATTPIPELSQPGESLDWLQDLEGTTPSTDMFETPQAESTPSGDEPDWLKGLGEAQESESPTQSADVPDWLSGLDGAQEAETPSQSADAPDWLSGLDNEQEAQPPAQPADIPDWLQGSEPKAEPASPAVESLGASAQEQDDAVAWLESLAAKHGAKPEELVTDPNKRSETPPDWVQQAQHIGGQPPAQTAVESLGASAEEQDDAVAWLESLAAKHGAKPEELVTDPNKRSETPPDWVQQAQHIGESQSAAPAEESPETDWVEGAQNIGEQFFAEFEQASESAPKTDETGMWLRDLEGQEEKTAAGETAQLSTQDDIPDWLSDVVPQEGAGRQEPEITTTPAADGDLSEWLSGLDDEPGLDFDAEFLRASARPPFPSPSEGQKQPSKPDLPNWLRETDTTPESVDDAWNESIASTPTDEPAPPPGDIPVTLIPSADLPDWLQGVDETKPAEAAPEHADEADTPPWLHREQWESEAEGVPPTPTSPSDWHPVVEEAELITPPSKQTRPMGESFAETPPPKPGGTASTPAPAKKKASAPARRAKGEGQSDANALNQAKAELDRGDIPTALDHFGKLIKKGKYLEEIITELSDSLYRYPVEVGIWQTLGDAYMRANRLKEALDAYNKAEELIR